MTQRITDTDLRALCAQLNKLTGSPLEYSTFDPDTGWRVNVGHFHISSAYGGVCLHRTANTSGGVSTLLHGGHQPRRELWGRIHAFMLGIEFAQRLAAKGE